MEIIDEFGFTVVFDGELNSRFNRFSLGVYADRPCTPSDFARFLRIYADKLEVEKTAEVTYTEEDTDH